MEVLINGLNTYLGGRAASHLQEDDFNVHGIVRNLNVFNTRLREPLHAQLHEVDLIRLGPSFHELFIKSLDVAYYFTQVHDFSDKFTLNLEILSLKNYIELIKRNNCRRLIFIARLMDRKYIAQIERVLKEERIDYTIVLKSVAIGKGSVVDTYIKNLLKFSYVPYMKKVANIHFKPIAALDVLKFVKKVAINTNFVGQTIGLGGPKEMTFQSLFRLYAQNFSPNMKFHGVSVPAFLLNIIHKNIYHINEEDHLEFNRLMEFEYPINNQPWFDRFPFGFTSISQTIIKDC